MTRPPVPPLRSPVLLSGGDVLIDAATVPIMRTLIEVALQTRRGLWTARGPAEAERVARLRALVRVAFADPCTTATPPAVPPPDVEHSLRLMSATVREAAEVLQVSPQRVRQLLAEGRLSGRQTAPGRPWIVDPASVDAYDKERT